MKFSVRQVVASAAGAVIAAIIASLFGVKGTIIGVAIGSAVATFGTALISQSIERGHQAVKQVAVRVPDRTALLRRVGATSASGEGAPPTTEQSTLTEETASAATIAADDTIVMSDETSAGEPTIFMRAPGLPLEPPATDEVPVSTVTPEPELESELESEPAPRGIPWRAIAATAAIVFVLSLGTVTVIELIAGHPLSDLFGHSKSNDPSVGQLFNQSPPAPTMTTSTTTTSTTSTTTSTSTTTTTSTTVPGGSTTTTAPGQGTSTTTTTPGGTTTSTT